MRRVSLNELIAIVGGIALGIALFLPWYATSDNENAQVGACGPGDPGCSVTGFEVHDILRWVYVAAALAPLILTYIIARGHRLSWPRGEMTAVVAIAAFGLIVYNGLIDRPGEPSGEIGTKLGLWLAIAGTLVMLAGAALRASESERPRKPPGVL